MINIRDQNIRKRNGRYDEYERCELCNKRVGDNYCSDPRCNDELHGSGVVLCDSCGEKVSTMITKDALDAFENADRKFKRR